MSPLPDLGPQYTLGSLWRAGGDADLYLAQDREGQPRLVSMPREVADPSSLLRALVRWRDLDHRYLLAILDAGLSQDPPGMPFVVMEPLPTENTLRDLLQRGRLPRRLAREIARAILTALRHAQAGGVPALHGSLRPENILVEIRGRRLARLKLLAPTYDAAGRAASGAGGEPYLSPEQIASDGPLTAASDLFVVGVMYLEMLTGKVPYRQPGDRRATRENVLRQPAGLDPQRLGARQAAFLRRCLAKRPQDRFSSAAEALAVLESKVPAWSSLPPAAWLVAGLVAAVVTLVVWLNRPPGTASPPPSTAATEPSSASASDPGSDRSAAPPPVAEESRADDSVTKKSDRRRGGKRRRATAPRRARSRESAGSATPPSGVSSRRDRRRAAPSPERVAATERQLAAAEQAPEARPGGIAEELRQQQLRGLRDRLEAAATIEGLEAVREELAREIANTPAEPRLAALRNRLDARQTAVWIDRIERLSEQGLIDQAAMELERARETLPDESALVSWEERLRDRRQELQQLAARESSEMATRTMVESLNRQARTEILDLLAVGKLLEASRSLAAARQQSWYDALQLDDLGERIRLLEEAIAEEVAAVAIDPQRSTATRERLLSLLRQREYLQVRAELETIAGEGWCDPTVFGEIEERLRLMEETAPADAAQPAPEADADDSTER